MTLYEILVFVGERSPSAAIMALFLILALGAIVAVGLHDLIAWWWNRGLRRRRERLAGWSTDPRSITDREVESLR